MEYRVREDYSNRDHALIQVDVEVIEKYFAVRGSIYDDDSCCLDHIPTGHTMYRGTPLKCKTIAKSLATVPVSWEFVEPKCLQHTIAGWGNFLAAAKRRAENWEPIDWCDVVV